MMSAFAKSELYRKYITGLQFNDLEVYTVWGTDMLDEENDKMLVRDSKLVAFTNLDSLRQKIKTIAHPYSDKENFKNWVEEENLNKVYSTINVNILVNFNFAMLKDKMASLEVLHALNIIQDFYLQIRLQDVDSVLGQEGLILLKDFIYENYFWKKRKKNRLYGKLKGHHIIQILKDLYDDFYCRVEILF